MLPGEQIVPGIDAHDVATGEDVCVKDCLDVAFGEAGERPSFGVVAGARTPLIVDCRGVVYVVNAVVSCQSPGRVSAADVARAGAEQSTVAEPFKRSASSAAESVTVWYVSQFCALKTSVLPLVTETVLSPPAHATFDRDFTWGRLGEFHSKLAVEPSFTQKR